MKKIKIILGLIFCVLVLPQVQAQHNFHSASHTFDIKGDALEIYLRADFKIGNCGICNFFDTAYVELKNDTISIDARYDLTHGALFCGCTDYDTLNYSPLGNGNYTLLVNSTIYHYNEKGVLDTLQVDSDTSMVLISSIRGERTLENISISPNPSTGIYHLSGDFYSQNTQVSIHNLSGKLLHSEKLNTNNTIDLSHLPQGVYFVELDVDGEKVRKKIVKE